MWVIVLIMVTCAAAYVALACQDTIDDDKMDLCRNCWHHSDWHDEDCHKKLCPCLGFR